MCDMLDAEELSSVNSSHSHARCSLSDVGEAIFAVIAGSKVRLPAEQS